MSLHVIISPTSNVVMYDSDTGARNSVNANMCCAIVIAANRCWERGEVDKWFNLNRIARRPFDLRVNGREA